ncbi:MAG: TRAP transporter large permease subunit [Rhizorhabdus sp.]|nr:MAG: TRAP transporter large permease subunit [Rhizorhabdus sp.]
MNLEHADPTSASDHGPPPGFKPGTGLVEKGLTRAVELAVAALMTAEIVILFVGVMLRYLFHAPLIWLDELGSTLFIWLVMLGAVVATARVQHLRMTVLIDPLPASSRAAFSTFGTAVALSVLLLMIPPGIHYMAEEAPIFSPALEISASWKAAALPLSLVLMLAISLFQAFRRDGTRLALIAVMIAIVVATAATLFDQSLLSLGKNNIFLFFGSILFLTILAGAPIAFAFGLAACGYVAFATSAPMIVVASRMSEGMSHIILLSVPLFVFLGLLIEMTGMGRVMVRFLAALLGHVRGGLAYVLIGAMYLVSGISGSKVADMAAVAPVLFPELKARGYQPGDMAALLSATGAQTETIPPSLVLITIGSVTSVSIAALFTGGMLPALICGMGLCASVGYRFRRADFPKVERASAKTILRTFVIAVPALALPFVVRAAVVEGVATATEVSTIAIVYAALVGLLVQREFVWRRVIPMMVDAAALSGAILLIIGFATAVGWGLTQSGFSMDVLSTMSALPGGAPTFLAASVLLFIVLGSVLEGIPVVILFAPLLFPVAEKLGIHEVHYAMVVVLSMGVGLFTPPFGVGYYTACAVARVPPAQAMRRIWPYMFAVFIGLVAVTLIPWISTGFLKEH